MEEHQFPLDSDSHLRRQVIMEIEREKVQTKVEETRKQFVKLVRLFIVSTILTGVSGVVYKIFFPHMGVWIALCFVLFMVAFSTRTHQVFSMWRKAVKAKKDLENWNTVIADYNEITKEENYLPNR